MWSSPDEDQVHEPISDTLLRYGVPASGCVTVLVSALTILLCHQRLIAALRMLWDTYRYCTATNSIFRLTFIWTLSIASVVFKTRLLFGRTLDAKPQILKALALLTLVYFWFLPLLVVAVHYSKILTYVFLISTDFQICFFALMAEGAFKALKKKVKEHYKLLVKTSEDGGLLLYFDEPCLKQGRGPTVVDISRLRQVHRQLVNVMATVNHNYNIAVLVIIFSCRFFFTTYLYRWIATKFITIQLVYALLTLQRIFYLCYRYEALKRIERSTADMINGLDKSPLDLRKRAEFKLFLIQLKSHKMTFNCLQMFDLDFSLITSMFTATITYLMLLQQLK